MFDTTLLKALIRDANDAVLLLAPDRSVREANDAFLQSVPGARLGVDFMDLVDPRGREGALKQLVRAAGGDTVLVDIPHAHGEDEAVVEYRFFPVEGGQVAAIGRVRGQDRGTHEALGRANAELSAQRRMLDEIQLELTQVPFIDPVTGVWNRMQVIERLTGEWSRCERYGSPLACLLIDLEGVRQARGEQGDMAADQALKAVARRIKHVVRDHDIVGRFSGDAFVVIAVQSDGDGARRLAERIHEHVGEEPLSVEGARIPAGVRIGGATNRSAGVEILEDLFQVAENALEDARKASGRTKVAAEVAV